MKYDLKVEPDAENDAFETAIWYNKQKAGLGNEFLDAIENSLEKVQSNPFLYAIKYRQTRVAYTNRFPFGNQSGFSINFVFFLCSVVRS